MADIRRFTIYPGDETLLELESVAIIDLAPPASITGVGTNVVAMAGEFLKGDYNTPKEVSSAQDIKDKFGGYSAFLGDADGNGNGYRMLAGKKFARLVLVRVNNESGAIDITRENPNYVANADPPLPALRIPAGTLLKVGNNRFITAQDVDFAEGEGVNGTPITKLAVPVTSLDAAAALGYVITFDSASLIKNEAGGIELDPDAVPAINYLTAGENTALAAPRTTAQKATQYLTAIDSLLGGGSPANEVKMTFSARTDPTTNPATTTIRDRLDQNATDSSEAGVGRIAIVRPAFGFGVSGGTWDTSKVKADVDLFRTDRIIYAWPQVQAFFAETSENVNLGFDGFIAALLSQLPPEHNPGQATDYMKLITGFESGSPALSPTEYKFGRRQGIAMPKFSPDAGTFIIQSGITTSLEAGKKNISSRRMKDFLQESQATRLAFWVKKLMTPANKATIVAELNSFLAEMVSANNPSAQRIAGYIIDATSGNTEAKNAKGIFVVIEKIKLLPSMDVIVLQTEIGESVTFSEAA